MTGAEKMRFTEAVEKMRDVQRACEHVMYVDRSLNEKRKAAEGVVDLLLARIRVEIQNSRQPGLPGMEGCGERQDA